MGLSAVLDTNVIINLQKGKLDEALPVEGYYASIITEIELLSSRSITEAEAQWIKEFLENLSVVGITERVKREAITIRRDHGLRLPDAIIAAVALVLDVPLITNDKGFTKVPHLECRAVRLKET
jgi:predicted nucleic acid-binding protein